MTSHKPHSRGPLMRSRARVKIFEVEKRSVSMRRMTLLRRIRGFAGLVLLST
ncbi:hypothetical protein FOWG_15105 [Fusarium oxysporum f. sp. lycopersici MN25]|nr:hypothetical protein FOWG_17868 [Fusarium oxysporum f. sp. lycopersici MN25]EWZ79075.1 hypothetical protein FOWG_16760 [Fusarium oxysporum f. sp. lycopersici MN25]EWZ79993.1 hypothetical protein FOWG_16013 [Fusarium oxysporum f. sp. lycopersici MN25]EWZ81122.1 hypothetical protein FOWG_15105 [Fusarium oxysporum f. sp. lycopersici MN25]